MKNLRLSVVAVIAVSMLILTACKNESNSPAPLPQPGDKNSPEGTVLLANQTFENLTSLADNSFSTAGLKGADLSTCPTIATTTLGTYPLTVTFDWGAGCKGEDGITRSGKITAVLTAKMSTVGANATFTFVDFVTNDVKITGSHSITYAGPNTGNNWPRFNLKTDATMIYSDQKAATFKAEYIRLLAEGSSTPLVLADDVWRMEGSASGTTREGITWTATTKSALVKPFTCKNFTKGILEITPKSGLTRTIDYGTGDCDNKATLTIGTVVTTIEF